MSGLNIETNSLSNTAFPENRKPDEKPSEHDLQLFYSTLNDRPADRARLVNRSNLTDRLGKFNTPTAWVQESSYIPKLRATGGTPAQQAALSQTIGDFKEQFTEHAQSQEGFHRLLTQAFGPIDADQAEAIRLQSSKGDFTWLPKIELVSGDPTFRGAYSADEGTVFLNQALLDDPAEALRVLTEEVGHHLETQVRTGDSAGDEGELFRRLFAGETLSGDEIAAFRSENDHGVINVNGRGVQVEFESQNDEDDGINGDGITIIGVDGDDDVTGVSIIINDEGDSNVTFSIGDLFDSHSNDNEEYDFRILADGRGFVRARNRDLNHDVFNATGTRQGGFQPYYNGRIIDGSDGGDWQFELTYISGSDNNYDLVANKTPYDELVSTSGIDWQLLDRAWLELTAQGNTEAAALLRQGTLPPLELFSEGLQNELKVAQTAPPIDGPFANGGPIPGKEVDLGNGQKMVRASGDKDIVGASNAGPYINGRVVGPEDGFGNFRLEKIEGTHNNYTLLPDITPYGDLAQASGIPWQEIDRAHLDLNARGLTAEANLLKNDGVLPPLSAFESGSPIETALRGHYDRLAQQVAETTGLPVDRVNGTIDDLYTREPRQASNLLLGNLSEDQLVNAFVNAVMQTFEDRRNFYEFADQQLNSRPGATQTDWFRAAAQVNEDDAMGAIDNNPLGNLVFEPPTSDYLRFSGIELARQNVQTFLTLYRGEMVPGIPVTTQGDDLDLALVTYEQNRLETITDDYFRNVINNLALRSLVFDDLNEFINGRGVAGTIAEIFPFGDERTERIIKDEFTDEGIEFNIGNKLHRIELGEEIIKENNRILGR